jgi:hypothetical protein
LYDTVDHLDYQFQPGRLRNAYFRFFTQYPLLTFKNNA